MNSFLLTVEMAILINQKLILEHSADGQAGAKDYALLDSALKRPQPSLFGDKASPPPLPHKALSSLESLAQNHVFHNTKKRTALVSMALFLRYKAYLLRFSHP